MIFLLLNLSNLVQFVHFLHILINKIKMNQMRQTILSEVELTASKRRFGLFSQPPPLAIGDDGPYHSKHARKGEDGKPITKPRNMLPGPNRSGAGKKSFIQPTESIYVDDKYLNPQEVDRLYYKKFHSRASFHEMQFKPSEGRKSMSTIPYKHIDENPQPKARPLKNETGRVVTKDKNITTNPMPKVHNDLFKPYKHIIDPYQRKSMIDSQDRKLSKQKMPPEMIRSMSHGDILFSSHKAVYGYDDKAKQIMKSKSPFIQSPPRKFNHETQFKLSRRGHGDAIGKYPEFIMPSTEAKSQIVKQVKHEKKQQKQRWKFNGAKSLSRPTPTISYSSANLRKYL